MEKAFKIAFSIMAVLLIMLVSACTYKVDPYGEDDCEDVNDIYNTDCIDDPDAGSDSDTSSAVSSSSSSVTVSSASTSTASSVPVVLAAGLDFSAEEYYGDESAIIYGYDSNTTENRMTVTVISSEDQTGILLDLLPVGNHEFIGILNFSAVREPDAILVDIDSISVISVSYQGITAGALHYPCEYGGVCGDLAVSSSASSESSSCESGCY